jgi:phytoene dehydrogenase-like protein
MTASSSEETKQVIIVGGGVGGLAVASRIKSSYESCQITILEKNPQTGGRCGSFVTTSQEFGSFRHERGPSLLLLPDVYRKVFEECSNRNANDYGLSMKQCAPAYQVVFEDGSSIDVGFPRQPGDSMTPEELKSRKLMDSYEENGSSKWDEYMRATSAFLDCGLPNFIEERLDLLSFPNFLLEALRDYAKAWPLKPHSDVLDAIFESEKLKGLASFQDLYVGLEPYRNNELLGGGVLKSTSPAVFGLLAAIELHPNNKKSGGKYSYEVYNLKKN